MACRRPVILTYNCNLDDVGDQKAGWLVEPRISSVFEALNAAYQNASERARRGANARALVEARYTWDRIAEESIGLYRFRRPSAQTRRLGMTSHEAERGARGAF